MTSMYLVRYPEKPVRLNKKVPCTIGRLHTNTIVLNESRVSRNHLTIQWVDADQFSITDAGSSNGTYLNGEKIESGAPVPLRDWDKIRIASFIFTCRKVESRQELEPDFDDFKQQGRCAVTEVITIEDIKRHARSNADVAFMGNLQHLCPIELFQMLEIGAKTGVVTIRIAQREGRFSLLNGQIVSASFDDKQGDSAVYEILPHNQGTFVFDTQTNPSPVREIHMTTTNLLMEGCRRMDEAAHFSPALGA